MLNFYLASPFFNSFDKRVKEKMRKSLWKTFHGGYRTYDPESGTASKDYGDCGTNVSPELRLTLARRIYRDNIIEIDECNCLVFPRYTTDAGTLFEVGYALSHHKRIWRYDFLTDTLEEIVYHLPSSIAFTKTSIVLSEPSDVVLFGYMAGVDTIRNKLVYSFKSEFADNIMLAANFKFKDKSGRILSPEERDWEGMR